jgi:hypothetical protein
MTIYLAAASVSLLAADESKQGINAFKACYTSDTPNGIVGAPILTIDTVLTWDRPRFLVLTWDRPRFFVFAARKAGNCDLSLRHPHAISPDISGLYSQFEHGNQTCL